jgi:predicted nucleic acid-binding protein
VIYLDTSVALAHLLSESRRPPAEMWSQRLVASRLMTYEAWTRLHAMRLGASHGDALRALVGHVDLLELAPPVLARALEPFPRPVRSLDALHLASMDFLVRNGQDVRIATYDERLADAAASIGISRADV